MPPNFALLDVSRPEVARLIAAMVQARDAVKHRTWSHPQDHTGEAWWADVLAAPRARKRERRTDLAVKQAFYRLADEKRETILVACSKCDWRAAFLRDDLIASHAADYSMPNLLNHLTAPSCSRGPDSFSAVWGDVGLGVTFHSLRHCHASMLIAQRVPITEIAKRLGHASPATTLSIYAHMFE
jgi:hypothetical protein